MIMHKYYLLVLLFALHGRALAQSALQPDPKTRYYSIRSMHNGGVGKVAYSADGELLAFNDGENKNLYVWDLETIRLQTTYPNKANGPATPLEVYSPNLRWVAENYMVISERTKKKIYNDPAQPAGIVRSTSLTYSASATNGAPGWVLGPSYTMKNGLYPLAVTDDGIVITTVPEIRPSEIKSIYADKMHLEAFKDIYTYNPATNEKKKVAEGRIPTLSVNNLWSITPDSKTFVVYNCPTITAVDLVSGKMQAFSISAVPNSKVYYALPALSPTAACFERDLKNGTHELFWLNLKDGSVTAPLVVSATQNLQFFGAEGWSYNEKAGEWTVYARQGDELNALRKVAMDRRKLGIPKRGGYHFQVMKDEQVFGIPSGKWNDYSAFMDSVAYVLYDAPKGKVTSLVRHVFNNGYSSGSTAPVASSVGSMSAGSSAGSSAASSTDCASKLKKLRYPIGTKFSVSGGSLGEQPYEIIITGFDCNSKQYIAARRRFTDAQKSFFKTDANISFYAVERVTYPENADLDRLQRDYALHNICGMCLGSSIVSEEVVHTRGGKWEQVNFNIEVYTPLHVIAAWKQRAACPNCQHTGLVPRK